MYSNNSINYIIQTCERKNAVLKHALRNLAMRNIPDSVQAAGNSITYFKYFFSFTLEITIFQIAYSILQIVEVVMETS